MTNARNINRRSVFKAGAMLAASLPFGTLLASCGSDDKTATTSGASNTGASPSTSESESLAGGSLVYADYGGTPQEDMIKAQIDPFIAATGIKVTTVDETSNVAKLNAMVDAGKVEWDLMNATTVQFGNIQKQGLIQQIDYSLVSKDGYSQPDLVTPYGLPQYGYGMVLYWNRDLVDGPLTDWADLWDVAKYPGKRAFQSNGNYVFEQALMADGVDPKDLYPMDLDRGIAKLQEIADISTFQDINTIQNLVAQGDVTMGCLQLSRVQNLIDDGVPLEYTFNKSINDYVWWCVPEGAQNIREAHELLKFSQSAERQLEVFHTMGFTPTLTSALDQMTQEERDTAPGTPETSKTAVNLDAAYYADHHTEIVDRIQQFMRG